MECHEALVQIHASLDREISPEDQSTLDRHLAACPRCRAEAASVRALVEAVRRRVVPGPAPAHIRMRVQAALRTADRRSSALRFALVAAAGLLLAASALFVLQRAHVLSTPDVIASTVRAYDAICQGKVPLFDSTGDPVQATRIFLSRNLDVPVPQCSTGQFKGGCCCNLECSGDKSVPCVLYSTSGRTVCLWVFDAPSGDFAESDRRSIKGLDAYCYSLEGKTAFACVGRSAMHVWVSDLDADSLASFVRESDEARPVPAGASVFPVTGMNCLMCASRGREALLALPGVRDAWISLSRGEAVLVADRSVEHDEVASALAPLGFHCGPRR